MRGRMITDENSLKMRENKYRMKGPCVSSNRRRVGDSHTQQCRGSRGCVDVCSLSIFTIDLISILQKSSLEVKTLFIPWFTGVTPKDPEQNVGGGSQATNCGLWYVMFTYHWRTKEVVYRARLQGMAILQVFPSRSSPWWLCTYCHLDVQWRPRHHCPLYHF